MENGQKNQDLHTQRFRLKREITVGDVLTIFAILISAITLFFTWSKEREQQRIEQGNKVKSAAARTLAKLERWQEYSLRYYQNVEPLFVDTSNLFAKEFDTVAARDYLWKKLGEEKAIIEQRKFDEQVETTYVELYSYDPSVFDTFVSSIKKLKEDDEVVFDSFRSETEINILDQESGSTRSKHQGKYQTASLGNLLRKIRDGQRSLLKSKLDATLKPMRKMLLNIIAQSDEQIAEKRYAPLR